MAYRVVQTVEAFRYPAGKVWGPYLEKGDGVIEEGEFGAPAMAARPVDEGGPSAALEEKELTHA